MKLLRLFMIPMALFATACDSTTEPDPNAHVGTYALVSVDGASLPAPFGVEDGLTLTVLSGSLTLNADRTASFSIRFRATQGTFSVEETESGTGTYSRTGTSITVQFDDGESETLAYDEEDDELTLTSEGTVLVFRK